MNIAAWSIRHPYIIISFYLGILGLAIWAIVAALPVRTMPYVQSPLVALITMYPGLSAEDVEMYISQPIEQRMTDLKNVHYLRSVSSDELSIVSVEFYYGTDMKKAQFDVQALYNVIQADLPFDPANLKPSWVIPIDPLNIPVLMLSLTGDGWDPVKLRQLAENEILNEFKTVDNVESIVVKGGYKRQIQVIVDRDKLRAYRLSTNDIEMAVDAQNVGPPSGILTRGPREIKVRTPARPLSADEIKMYPITSDEGRVVYVKDVARVLDTYEERRGGFHYNGKPVIGIQIIQEPDASSPRVNKGIMQKARELEGKYPGIHFEPAFDNARFVQYLLRNLTEELGLAVLFTVIVVLFFLGNLRATAITSITIPMSMAWSILMLVPIGMTLNSSTMVGLLIVIGRLVDDSIIDIHAIQRHLRMGKSPAQAAADGVMEVRPAVMASTFLIMIGLTPLLFCGGVTETMFIGLVWPGMMALLASMVVSFTLTPLLAAWLLGSEEERMARRNPLERYVLAPCVRGVEKGADIYREILRWSLDHRLFMLASVVACVALGIAMYPLIGFEMMPLGDIGQGYGLLEMQPGTSFAATEAAATKVEEILLRQPEVERVATEVGMEPGGTYYTAYAVGLLNSASFMVTLVEKEERKRNIWEICDAVDEEVKRTIPGVRRFAIKEMGVDVMATAAAPVQLLVYGKDLEKLDEMRRKFEDLTKEVPNLYQPHTSWAMTQPQLHVEVDRARAQELGLSPAVIARQAYFALRGGKPREFFNIPGIRRPTILIRYEEPDRWDPEDLKVVAIATPDGREVPLASVARVVEKRGVAAIEHDLMRRAFNVLGYYRKDTGVFEMQLQMDLAMRGQMAMEFPAGYGFEFRGTMQEMMRSFGSLLTALKVSLFFMFLVLIAQFRSILMPFRFLLSVPLVISGAFLGILFMKMSISTVSIFALIILVGMELTTAILLIEFIEIFRREGMSREEAILHACPIRFVPILMTTFTTLAALVPLAFFPPGGVDAYQPLGVVIVFGGLIAMFLGLLELPVVYVYLDDFSAFLRRIFLRGRIRETSGDTGHGT